MKDSGRQRILILDPASGIAGDMFVAAMLELGLSIDALREGLADLDLSGFHVASEPVRRGSIAATHFSVLIDDGYGGHTSEAPQEPHGHHPLQGRTYTEIVDLLRRSELTSSVRDRALSIFEGLAVAEARVHGCDVGSVHFHEVGAVDSIVDIVAASLGLELLGIDEVWCREISVGHGTVQTDHGTLPVPCPATAEILKGMPVHLSEIPGELVTPTGAAILRSVVTTFLPRDSVEILATGYGAGSIDRSRRPNVLRALLCHRGSSTERDSIVVLETQVDDMTPEQLGYLRERLQNEGALDVLILSAHMKKNRPGHLIQVLADESAANDLEDVLFLESSTFGVRRHDSTRRVLERCSVPIDVDGHEIQVKIGHLNGRILRAEPEYEDVAAFARSEGIAFGLARARAMEKLSQEPVEWPNSQID